MQQIILIVLLIFFILGVLKQILYWSWLWQLKEYRIDRMRAHFRDIGNKSEFLALIGYSALRQKKAPKFTAKSILIFIFSFLFSIIFAETRFFKIYDGDPVSAMFFGYLIMPIVVFPVILILNFFSDIFKMRTIAKAAAKIAKFPKLRVIGITGSYGKSTTKEILADILSKKYRVFKTPANINTAIGIAQLILDKLDDTYEIFVVEMGAYKIGEIKEICDMVRPRIGIITAINEQHLALFGAIQNTIKAKFELVDSLPKDGLAILNGDGAVMSNVKCQMSNQAQSSNVKIILFGFGENNDLQGYDFKTEEEKARLKIKYRRNEIGELEFKNIGKFNVYNILGAIAAAQEIGMSFGEIFKIIQKSDWSNFSFKIFNGLNGAILIDDTYNANPDGVLAALDYIKNRQGRKIIIMSSLIELGGRAHEIHQKIGKEISFIASKVFFMDIFYISDIRKGVAKNKDSDVEIINEKNIKKISENLKNELKSTDTVLFINRGSRKVLELLKK